MSHFVVLVTGDNVEDQLAPFEECPSDPAYIEFDDYTDEWKNEYANEKNSDGVPFNKAYPTFEEYVKDWHGGTQDEDGNWGHTHNPNAKWDWWQVGGRWSDFWLMKQNNRKKRQDIVLKRDIDFEGMRAESERKAIESFDKYEKATAGIEPPEPWDTFRTKFERIEDARTAWSGHPWNKALNTAGFQFFLSDPHEHFMVGKENAREKYIEHARRDAFSTYAILHNGEWIQKGEMGWFGMSSDEMSDDEWLQAFHKFIDELPEDTPLTIVDCHI
jgi:hypothetical protein